MAERGPAQDDLALVFGALVADSTIDGALDKDNMPLTEEPPRVRDDLAAVGQ